MKTIKTYNTLKQALKAVKDYSIAFSVIANCNHIISDCEIDCDAISKDFEAFKLNGMLSKKNNYFCKLYPYTYYFGIRERGIEGGTVKEHVIERLKVFGMDTLLATMKLVYNGNDFALYIKTK